MRPPRVLEGKRRLLLARLIANGLTQAGVAIAIALLISATISAGSAAAPAEQAVQLSALVLGAITYMGLRAWQRRDAEALGLEYVHDLRVAIFRHVCSLPRSPRSPKLGTLLTRMTNDLLAVKNWVSYGLAGSVVASITLVVALAFLLSTDWRYAAASGSAFVLCGLAAAAVVPRLDTAVRKARTLRGKLARNLGEKLLARHAIEAMGRTEKETKKVARHSNKLTNLLIRRALLSGMLRFAPDAALPLAVVAGVILANVAPRGEGVVSGLGEESAVAWIFLMGIAATQLLEAARAWDYRISFVPAMSRVQKVLDLKAVPNGELPIDEVDVRSGRTLRANALAARAGRPGISFAVAQGELVVIEEATPDVRSSALRSLARLEGQTSGVALLGDTPIERIRLSDYRRSVALVSPAIPLFRGTVRGNLTKAGGATATRELLDIAVCLGLAAGEDELAALLTVPIGEGARGLPPDVDCRVRLLSALLRRPSFLLIDDDHIAGSSRLLEALAANADRWSIGIAVSASPGGDGRFGGLGKMQPGDYPRLIHDGRDFLSGSKQGGPRAS